MSAALFVCCHAQTAVPAHPLLVPIQAGAALSASRFPGFIPDDSGDHISGQNRSYCELTALYWAWKNCDAEHIGLFHYRRYLYPSLPAKRPYIIRSHPDKALLDRLGYAAFEELIERYDLIMPIGEDMHIPVREHYAAAPHHHRCDLELAERIVGELHPDYREAMERYFAGTVHFFGNIAIFSRAMLDDYCRWLFPILSEYDTRADRRGYGAQEQRVDGYLAERLLGVYYTRQSAHCRTTELPGIHFHSGLDGCRRRAVNLLLPPGSGGRAAVKNALGRLRSDD